MTIARRHFIQLAAGAAALPALPRTARALDYPTRPVHVVTGYPAGAGPDVIGRLAAQWLGQRLNQRIGQRHDQWIRLRNYQRLWFNQWQRIWLDQRQQ